MNDTYLMLSDLEDKVNHSFSVSIEGADPVELTLSSCKALTVHDFPGRKREPFSLIFHGPLSHHLPQQTYTLKHESIGEQYFFLVPVGQTENAFQYEAIFT